MHYLESHLRAGSHDCVGAVRAVADDDVLAARLLELEVVLYLARAVARTLALARSVRHLSSLLAVADGSLCTVVLLYEILHSLEVSAACAYEDTHLSSVEVSERTCYQERSRALCDRCVVALVEASPA